MTVKVHIVSSAALAVVIFNETSSAAMALFAFLSGILIDLDHLLDFLVLSGMRFSVKNLFRWCNEGLWEKIVLILHSYELYIIFALFAYYFPHPVTTGICLGVGLHLLLDQIGNRYMLKHLSINPLFYFFTYRAWGGFRKERLRVDKK